VCQSCLHGAFTLGSTYQPDFQQVPCHDWISLRVAAEIWMLLLQNVTLGERSDLLPWIVHSQSIWKERTIWYLIPALLALTNHSSGQPWHGDCPTLPLHCIHKWKQATVSSELITGTEKFCVMVMQKTCNQKVPSYILYGQITSYLDWAVDFPHSLHMNAKVLPSNRSDYLLPHPYLFIIHNCVPILLNTT